MRLPALFAWPYALLLGWFYTQNGIQGQCPAYSPNFVVQHGYRLYGHVIIWLYAEKEVLCRLKCNMDKRCLTFNFEEATRVCELNDADHKEDLQEAQGFVYVDMKKKKKSAIGGTTTIAPTGTRPGTAASTSTSQTITMDRTSTVAIPTTSITPSTTPATGNPGQCAQKVSIGIQNKSVIPDNYITASRNNQDANKARLNFPGGWFLKCSSSLPCNNQWLQVNVGKIAKITRIATQGHKHYQIWVTSYTLNTSIHGGTPYTLYNNGEELSANSDMNSIVYNDLKPAIKARYVRIVPTKWWHHDVALRVELYECKQQQEKCSHALGMESGLIKKKDLAVSTSPLTANDSRLGPFNSWVPLYNDDNPWLQIDLRNVKRINGIATQGHRFTVDLLVEEFRLQYRNVTPQTLSNYTVDGKPKHLKGNTDHNNILFNALDPPIIAQIVRILPIAWRRHIAMRVELYGCPYKGVYDGSKL